MTLLQEFINVAKVLKPSKTNLDRGRYDKILMYKDVFAKTDLYSMLYAHETIDLQKSLEHISISEEDTEYKIFSFVKKRIDGQILEFKDLPKDINLKLKLLSDIGDSTTTFDYELILNILKKGSFDKYEILDNILILQNLHYRFLYNLKKIN